MEKINEKEKKISAEASLSTDMPKGKGSKTTPSNKSLDAEDSLADSPKGNKTPKKASGKAPSNKNLEAEDYLSDAPKFKKSVKGGNKKLKPEGDLSKMPKYGKGHNNTSKSMDAEEYLSDSKYMKSFGRFIKEEYFADPELFSTPSDEPNIVDDRGGIENKTYLEISDTLKLTNNKEDAHCFLDEDEAEEFATKHNITNYQLEIDDSGENFIIIATNSLEGADINMEGNLPKMEEPDETGETDIFRTRPTENSFRHIKRPFTDPNSDYMG